MTQSEIAPELPGSARSLNLRWIPPLFVRPRRTLSNLLSWESPSWATPVLLIALAAVLVPIASGPAARELAIANQPPLPPDFQYYTQAQQEQFQRALEATTGPLYIYALPMGAALGRVLIGWLFSGFGLYLALTVLGGRLSSRSLLSLAAWAGLPYALRELVRAGYVLSTGQLIQHPGLSGLLVVEQPSLWQAALGFVDLYWIWYIALLLIGLRSQRDTTAWKSWVAVLVVQLCALLLQAAPVVLSAQLGNLNVIRPFGF